MDHPTTEQQLITAAFVLLFETSIAGRALRECDRLEPIIDALRHTISLSREDAQYLLQTGTPDIATSAFVLAYEGIGAYRADPDFIFTSEDMIALATARSRVRMSLRGAVTILEEAQVGTNS